MPQLDPSTFGSQLFWLAICFISLFIVLSVLILPRIASTLSTRRNRVQDDLEAAERLRDEAASALTSYEEALADARANAVKLAQQVRLDVQGDMDKQKAELDAQIASRVGEAEARIAASREDAMSNIEDLAKSIVGEIVETVSGQSVDAYVCSMIKVISNDNKII